jgi:hypothetical protein
MGPWFDRALELLICGIVLGCYGLFCVAFFLVLFWR